MSNTATKSTTKVVLKRLKAIDKIWHPESTLVFKSLDDKKVIGRFFNHEFISLDDVALDLCTEWNFSYDPDLVEEVDESSSSVVDEEDEKDEEDEDEVEKGVEEEEKGVEEEEKGVEEEEDEVEKEEDEVEKEVDKKEVEKEVEVDVEVDVEKEVEVEVEKEVEKEKVEKEKVEKEKVEKDGEFDKCISKLSEMYIFLYGERDKFSKLYQKEVCRNEELKNECKRVEGELQSLKEKFENMKKIFTM